jgi:hypothetical protein
VREPQPDHLHLGNSSLLLVQTANGHTQGVGLIDHEGQMAAVQRTSPGVVSCAEPWRRKLLIGAKPGNQPQKQSQYGSGHRQTTEEDHNGGGIPNLYQQLAGLAPEAGEGTGRGFRKVELGPVSIGQNGAFLLEELPLAADRPVPPTFYIRHPRFAADSAICKTAVADARGQHWHEPDQQPE